MLDDHFGDWNWKKIVKLGTRGFRDQNAGPDPGWLVAAGGLKKKNGRHNFFCPEARLSTNDTGISIIYYTGL
jgi:hypothetical protein